MSAQQHMRHMLDQLMGTGRNGEVDEDKVQFFHQRVCKCFLLRCCPHDIFSATRCDLGRCPKVHDFALRADYDNAIKTKDYDYHPEVLTLLKNFITETERRTQVAKQRLAETQQTLTANESIRSVKVQVLDKKIEDSLANLTKVGEEANVEESMDLMKNVEKLKADRVLLEKEYRIYVPNSKTQQQNLRVCKVCSSYLGFDDDDERLADHFKGRLHLGYAKIRALIDEFENSIQEKHIRQFLDKEFAKNAANAASDIKSQSTSGPTLQIWSNIHKHSSGSTNSSPFSSAVGEKRKHVEPEEGSSSKVLKASLSPNERLPGK